MKFKKGMRVRIAKKVEKVEGWKDEWVKEMDQFLNRYGDIASVKKDGSCDVKVEVEGITLNFHQSSLEEVHYLSIGSRVTFVKGVSEVRGMRTDLPYQYVDRLMGVEGVVKAFRPRTREFASHEMVYVDFPSMPGYNGFYWHILCFKPAP